MLAAPRRRMSDLEDRPMKLIRFQILAVSISLFFATSLPVRAGEPTEQLKASISEFVTILANTPVAELQASGLPEKARLLVDARFDFAEMTQRSLGSHWTALDAGEQREFIDAFTQRLLAFYGRAVRSSHREAIHFGGEVQEGKQARVATKVVSGNGDEFPIEYRLHDVNGQWKVYDVSIDHVSLVQNYRAQFERVIAKSSLRDLLRKIKNQDS
jgi:phospholipid transport system substrate-binding protein